MEIYYSAIAQGTLWGIMGIGLYISFRILKFADLTSEASFTMGGAVAVTALTQGVHPLVALALSVIFGALAGLVTGILMTILNIPALLSGIITLTGLYSINLRIMGKANVSLRNSATIYQLLDNVMEDKTMQFFVVGAVLSVLAITLISFFFTTDIGQSMIATGDNEVMAASLGIATKQMKCLALMLSNGLIGLSGALIAQSNSAADISMGFGTVIIALASIILGEVIFKHISLPKRFYSIMLGAILYRVLLVAVLKFKFNPSDFRLISASLLALLLALPKIRQKLSDIRERIR